MKKIIFLCALGGLFSSCQKEKPVSDNEPNNKQRLYSVSSTDNGFGLLHNQYMDVAYNKFLQMDDPTYIQCSDKIKETVNLLNNEFGYSWTSGYMGNLETIESSHITLNQMKAALMDDSYLGNVYTQINNELLNSDNLLTFQIAVNNIYDSKEQNCPASKLTQLKAMCSVAVSSYDYWENNYENWGNIHAEIMNGPGKKETDEEKKKREAKELKEKKDKIKEFVGFDLAGAFGGVCGAVLASGFCALMWD
jgi:hypothetical protein